jgi:hypothetical protein
MSAERGIVAVLPNRRLAANYTIDWGTVAIHVGVGFDRAGVPREVFAAPKKRNRSIDATCADIAIMISFLLQDAGFTVDGLLDRMSRPPVPETEGVPDAVPRSIPRLLLETMQVSAREEGPRIKWAFECGVAPLMPRPVAP